MEFNSKDYISQFYFMKYDHTITDRYRQKVSANLCLKELKIEILNSGNKVIAVFGYRLDYVFDTLLPLVKWELFEKQEIYPDGIYQIIGDIVMAGDINSYV